MICKKECPRGYDLKPLSNIVSESSYVCACYHDDLKIGKYQGDTIRHCFVSEYDDFVQDLDGYDIKSIIAVLSEALLIDELREEV